MTDPSSRPGAEFIADAGNCLVTRMVLVESSETLSMMRRPSQRADDNGWRIMSLADSVEDVDNPETWHFVDFNEVCAIEPALTTIWSYPVGSALLLVREGEHVVIVDTFTGQPVPAEPADAPRASGEPAFDEFGTRFQLWRLRYSMAELPGWATPSWADGRLRLRRESPGTDWNGYVVTPRSGGFDVTSVSAHGDDAPTEHHIGFYSEADEAGKRIVFEVGERLREAYDLAPLAESWRAAGPVPELIAATLTDSRTEYRVHGDADRYAILPGSGPHPESRLLTLTYDELDELICQGMPAELRVGGTERDVAPPAV